ncbi:MAG: flagellar export chaperone FlgN [Pseudomonas sp.]|uniref:flagella synthesis protein FlgN n=1 Tax=Pseudomonas abieticivorans TaxID=2931382 RepID=UPI0020BDDCC3|nr:flagellar export chaperone FlgN [Pseudomonas sp. PIA16]MDE1168383.1 flagellar export chaperone FlgN [Pseudomonas sp.]
MSLAKHLGLQYLATRRLVEALEQERLALTTARIDGQQLGDLTATKQALLQNLEELESTRRRAQRTRGYAPGAKGAAQAAKDEGCLSGWLKLQELASRARQLNQINGETLRVRLQQNQRILNCLTELGGGALYGPDGRPHVRASLSGLA